MSGQLTLLPVFAIHCVFCPYVVRAVGPVEGHDEMEGHYAEAHGAHIRALVNAWRVVQRA